MIFVTVGASWFPFLRLVKEMDKIAATLEEEVFIQKGTTQYKPKYAKSEDFLSFRNYCEMIKRSTLVVGHAGAGTILQAFKFRKPIVVVPRLKKFEEIPEDHQLELARALTSKVIVVYEIKNLKYAIKIAKTRKFEFETEERKMLIKKLRKYLRGLK